MWPLLVFFWTFCCAEAPWAFRRGGSTSDTVTALVGGSVTMKNSSAGDFCLQEEQIHSGQGSVLSYLATLLLFAMPFFFFLSFSLSCRP